MKLNENDELQEYFEILCNKEVPEFIYKYLRTDTMERLKGVSFFSGIDYNLIPTHDLKYYYSRYDHSIATALIIWNLTKNKKETIVALLHCAGTPIFSHSVDYMLGDYKKQQSARKPLLDMIGKDAELIKKLEEDKLVALDFQDLTEYTILENDTPKFSAARLEGVFIYNLILSRIWTNEDIKDIYTGIQKGINEEKNNEIAFNNLAKAEKFYEGVYKYTYMMEQSEEKLTLQLISEVLKESIDNGIITEKNMYKLTEKEFITELMKHEKSKAYKLWNDVTKLTFAGRADINKEMFKCYSFEVKKRYVDPLIWSSGEYIRGRKVSKYIENRINNIMFLKDSKYFYLVDNL